MKEYNNDDQMDFIQYNQPFQKSKSDNINYQETNQVSEFAVLLHFSSSKSFSFKIPNSWNTKKLISFISLTFKSEFRNSIPTFIYKGNALQNFSESLLKEYFEPLKLNHIIITLKDKEKNNSKEESSNKNNKNILDTLFSKSNKEVFKTEEFCDMEKYVMNDYQKIFKEDSLNNFPLMSPAYNQRREQIKYDPQTEKFAQFEPVPLEDFPLRNYFQLKIIFKCIISFFALGIYIKGFNFVLFLCVLVIYYWYCINNIIEEFYKKKFQEIGLNEDEYKRIGEEIKDIGRKFGNFGMGNKEDYEEIEGESENEDDNGNKDGDDNEDIIYEEKSDENISNNNINKEANNNINIDFEEEMKDINYKDEKNNEIKEPMKDLEFKEEEKKEEINKENPQILNNNINKSLNENKNNININNNRIKTLNKKNKKKEQKKEKEEPEQETTLQIAYQILYLFFISFIPPWCDEFEAQNPIPPNNQHRENNNNDANNNNEENQNNINNDINNINNENNINNNDLFNNINDDINDNNNIGQQSSNSPQQEEDSNNNKMTSSKVANISEDSNKDNRMYNLLKKDNQSLNENEYVFSEHGPIDSLSMNSELFKQKKEKEKEKEKENKEKEKQIFEEDEKEVKEEDKHLKNE